MKYCAEQVYHQILHAIGSVIFHEMKLVLLFEMYVIFSIEMIQFNKIGI